MGQRILIKSAGGGSTGTLSDNGGTIVIAPSIGVVTLPSDAGYIYEVTVAFAVFGAGAGLIVASNASGLSIRSTGVDACVALSKNAITNGVEPSNYMTTPPAQHGPGTVITVTYFATSAAGDYAISYSYIGKKVINESF